MTEADGVHKRGFCAIIPSHHEAESMCLRRRCGGACMGDGRSGLRRNEFRYCRCRSGSACPSGDHAQHHGASRRAGGDVHPRLQEGREPHPLPSARVGERVLGQVHALWAARERVPGAYREERNATQVPCVQLPRRAGAGRPLS